MRRGQFRAQPTACPAWSAPRAAPCGHFAALPLVRSTFGLRGFPPNRRFAPHLRRIFGFGYSRLTARIVPRDEDACGTRPRTTTERGAARSVVAARGGLRKRAPRQNRKPSDRGKTGEGGYGGSGLRFKRSAGKPCGPKRSADGGAARHFIRRARQIGNRPRQIGGAARQIGGRARRFFRAGEGRVWGWGTWRCVATRVKHSRA